MDMLRCWSSCLLLLLLLLDHDYHLLCSWEDSHMRCPGPLCFFSEAVLNVFARYPLLVSRLMTEMMFIWNILEPAVDNESASLGIIRHYIISDTTNMAIGFIIP